MSLTFDDGPDPRWTPLMCAELERLELRGIFFVIGERVLLHPGVVRATVEAGHDVQLHCHRHVRHTQLGEDGLRCDTERALQALYDVGVEPTSWRVPWGVSGPATESVARSFGLDLVGWSIDTHDWRGDASAAMLAAAKPDLVSGGSVLMHDGLGPGATRSGCANTLALLGGLAQAVDDLGVSIEKLQTVTR